MQENRNSPLTVPKGSKGIAVMSGMSPRVHECTAWLSVSYKNWGLKERLRRVQNGQSRWRKL